MVESNLTIPTILENNFSKNSTRAVFTFPDGTSTTFAVFYNRVELLSEFLLRNGIKKGDCVAILDSSFTNLPIIYFALAQIGAITIPIVPTLSDEDLQFFLNQNQIVAVFASVDFKGRLKQQSCKHLKYFIDTHSFKFEALLEDTVSEKFEKEINKIKKAALELVKPEEVITPEPVNQNDEIQRLILPDLQGKWQFYNYTHQHLISSAKMVSETFNLDPDSKVLMLLPYYFNLTLSIGALGSILKGYQVVFARQPQTIEELELLVNQHQPTHVVVEAGMLEKVLMPHLLVTRGRSILDTSLKIFSFLKEKVFGSKFKFLQQSEWLICTNLTPINQRFNQFLRENKINHHLLFGIFETTSVLLYGRAFDDFCWIRGRLVKGMEAKVENAETNTGILYVKGPNVLDSDQLKFTKTPLIARTTGDEITILGFNSTIIELPQGFKLDARVLEASFRQLKEIVEVLVTMQNGQLILKVLPNPDLMKLGDEVLEEKIQHHIVEQIPLPLKISKISIERQPFPKTYFGQILRIN